MTDLSQAIWRKARRSAHNGGCVEIAATASGGATPTWSRRPSRRCASTRNSSSASISPSPGL